MAIVSQERHWSSITQKIFDRHCSLNSNISACYIRTKESVNLNLDLLPSKIDSVLPRWRDNLLSMSQLLTHWRFSVNSFSMLRLSVPETRLAVIVYSKSLFLLQQTCHWQIKNKGGPRMYPCGTPRVRVGGEEETPNVSVTGRVYGLCRPEYYEQPNCKYICKMCGW